MQASAESSGAAVPCGRTRAHGRAGSRWPAGCPGLPRAGPPLPLQASLHLPRGFGETNFCEGSLHDLRSGTPLPWVPGSSRPRGSPGPRPACPSLQGRWWVARAGTGVHGVGWGPAALPCVDVLGPHPSDPGAPPHCKDVPGAGCGLPPGAATLPQLTRPHSEDPRVGGGLCTADMLSPDPLQTTSTSRTPPATRT